MFRIKTWILDQRMDLLSLSQLFKFWLAPCNILSGAIFRFQTLTYFLNRELDSYQWYWEKSEKIGYNGIVRNHFGALSAARKPNNQCSTDIFFQQLWFYVNLDNSLSYIFLDQAMRTSSERYILWQDVRANYKYVTFCARTTERYPFQGISWTIHFNQCVKGRWHYVEKRKTWRRWFYFFTEQVFKSVKIVKKLTSQTASYLILKLSQRIRKDVFFFSQNLRDLLTVTLVDPSHVWK